MHYHTYNTLGLVLGGTPSGESSRYVYIFTKDLGLVGAHAQNTRHVSSKLRYALDAPARSKVSLVRGKNMWRLISAVPEKRFYSVFEDSPEKQLLCARTFSLLKKLLAGEEANPQLFMLVNDFLDFLAGGGNEVSASDGNEVSVSGVSLENVTENSAAESDLKDIEAILVIRILHLLGYIPENELTQKFAHSTKWSPEVISAMAPYRKEAVKIINESLRATGL